MLEPTNSMPLQAAPPPGAAGGGFRGALSAPDSHAQRGGNRPPRRPRFQRGVRPPIGGVRPFRPGPGAPPLKGGDRDKLKIMVLGGLEEVGRNCTLLEYGNDIILIDMGLQFPEEDMPGIDFIIPNMSYLRGKERNVRGVVITHGHYDHIGAIPYTVPRIGNPPIFALPIAAGIIKKRQTEYSEQLNIKEIHIDDQLVLGSFRVEFFHINHSIPDSAGIIVRTPVGTIVHTGDWKFDYTPVGSKPADFSKIARIGDEGVLALMGDSTNASQRGHQISERDIGLTLRNIIEKAQGRMIVGTFASLLSRIKQIIEIAQDNGKKVAIDGFSMKTNVEIAIQLGYIKVKPGTLIDIAHAEDYPPEKIVIMCTGAQGEERAALMRMANNEHRFIQIVPGDTVIFSSSIIPGNERTIQRLKDTLYRRGAEVIHYQMMDVHAGGHAMSEDIKLMLLLFKPKYYIPIEGNHFMLRENAKVAYQVGWTPERVFIADNGQVMEFARGEGRLTDKKVPTDYVFVDGLGVGDVSEAVLHDRQTLAADGILIAAVTVEAKTGKLFGSPDIISHGFVYMKDQKALVEAVRQRVRKVIVDLHAPSDAAHPVDPEEIRHKLRDDLGAFLFTKTQRRPMIVPVVIEV